jgi:hypothetical protein
MSIKHAAWIHGTAVVLEESSWSALRQSFFTVVRPSKEATSGWVYFPVPTPVIVDGTRLRAESAMVRFSTGLQASIGAVHIYDGEKKIGEHNATNYQGTLQFIREAVPDQPLILCGTGISILVNFNGSGPEAYIQLIGAGIDFY